MAMQRDGWSLPALAREAVRNVFAARSKLFIIALLAIIAGTAMSLFLAFEANAFRERLAGLDAQGRNLVVFSSASQEKPAQISRASCERLAGAPSVERAGLLIAGPSVIAIQLGQSVTTLQASTSLFPQLRVHQALIGSALKQPAGGGMVTTDRGVLETVRAAPQPEGLSSNSSIVLPLDPAVIRGDTCIAVLQPFAQAAQVIPTLAAQLDAEGGALLGAEATKQTLDPIALHLERTTRYLPLLIGLAGALIAGLANQLRAGELAVYRLSGTSRRSLAMILLLEQALIAGLGMTAATAALAATAPYLVSVPASFAWVLAGFALWLLAAAVFSIPVVARSALSMAKDR